MTGTPAISGTVLVTANAADPDAGYVGERLVQRGLALRTVIRDHGEVPSSVPDDTALLLMLGSEWSVVDPVRPEVLDAEVSLFRSAQRAGVPVLGLCYGAQVATHALGGRVSRAPVPEVGLVDVDTDEPGLVPAGPWWEFHTDVLEPPEGVRVVARNGCGVQAFVAPGLVGVQFHPEVRPATFDDWMARFPGLVDAVGADRTSLLALAQGRESDARHAAYTLVDAFLAAHFGAHLPGRVPEDAP